MKRIIRDARLVDDEWTRVDSDIGVDFALTASDARLIVPLAVYVRLQQSAWPAERNRRLGLLLGPEDAPEDCLPFLAQLPLIAVRFPAFTDGRGYSAGRLIRGRYGYTGELRAVGDILRDQLYFLKQCGFNAFDLRPGQDLAEALAAFGDYAWAAGAARLADER